MRQITREEARAHVEDQNLRAQRLRRWVPGVVAAVYLTIRESARLLWSMVR